MKSASKLAALLVLGTGVAGCGIGDGNTLETLEIRQLALIGFEQGVLSAANEQAQTPETLRMFDCFCSNLSATGTFTDGSTANFSLRTTWTSSDTGVVRVLNVSETDLAACPGVQQGAGMVIPVAPGDATIRVEFASLVDTLEVHVEQTPDGSLTLAPVDTSNVGHVAVGAQLPLAITGTLEGRPHTVTANVTSWALEPADTAVATITGVGTVRGVARDAGATRLARASFGTCSVSPTLQVRVGEVIEPMALSHEAGFTDEKLAINTNEDFKAVAALDFGGGSPATGEQDLSGFVRMDYEQPCTLRSFDDTAGACVDVPGTCVTTTSVCGTSCASGMDQCRVEPLSFTAQIDNRVVATIANPQPAAFFAKFPASRGSTTALTAAIDETATTITVDALTGYPSTTPWDGVIDAAGVAEIVRVTAVDETTLTVTRSVTGTVAAHAQGASFDQRTFLSDTKNVTAVSGTLGTVSIDPVSTTLGAYATVQLGATGQFANENRTQPITHLSASASNALTWISAKPSVASIASDTGMLTSSSDCGGVVAIRARSAVSEVIDTESFLAPSDSAPDTDGNGNADSNDAACLATDPHCDQLNFCVQRADPPPPGVVCDDPAPPC
jgi:hypothetical protein